MNRSTSLVVTPHPLTLEGQTSRVCELVPGETLLAFLERAGVPVCAERWVVSIGGVQVAPLMWARTRPAHGQLIECRSVAGRDYVRIAAFAVLAYYTLGAGATGAGGWAAGGGFWTQAAQVGLYMAGSMVINKVLPPASARLKTYDQQTGSTYSLAGGRNRARPFEPLGLLFGTVKVVPDFATQPYSWFEGDNQIQYVRLHGGINVKSVAEIKIGATSIDDYADVRVSQAGFPGTTTKLDNWANVDTVAGALLTAPSGAGAYTTRTTSTNVTAFSVDLVAQLYDMQADGSMATTIVQYQADYRLLPSGPWTAFSPAAPTRTLTSRSTAPVRRTETLTGLAAGQYEVRMRKMTVDVATATTANALEWVALKSFQEDSGAYSKYPQVGIRIRASGQLNGSLDEVSWVATQAETPVWNGTSWVTESTRNPGAQILQFARGIYDDDGRLMAGMGLPDDQIDIEALKAFMVHCTANGYVFDHWFDAPLGCRELLEAIAWQGLGSISDHTGKLGVVWMAAGQPIENIVSMANIKRGRFGVDYNTRATSEELELTWFDRDDSWRSHSVRVLAPGVTVPKETARLAPAGLSTDAGGLLLARVAMGQNIYQRKTVSWEMDFEHVTFRRMSVISLSHDLTQWGYGGRLKAAVSASGVVTLTLDSEVPWNSGATVRKVGLRIPGETGYRIFSVAAFTGTTHTLTLVEAWPGGVPFPGATTANPAHDTLWMYDFKAVPGKRLRVLSIEPSDDYSGAKLSAVPEDDEFWNYVATGAYYAPPTPAARPPVVVSGLHVTQQRVALSYDLSTELTVTFDVSGPFSHAEVWGAPDGSDMQYLGMTRTSRFSGWRVAETGTVNIEVRAFDELGRPAEVSGIAYSVTLGAPVTGLNTARVLIYQRAVSAPALPSATTTYTFATGALTGLNNGWSTTIPAGSNPLYVSAASAIGSGATDTIASGEWAAAVVLVQDGAAGGAGTAGLNAATVYLFQRTSSASAPSLPSAAVTYTFATGVATGVNNGWTQSMPTSGGAFRWMTTAAALGTGTTDSVASGEWAAASLIAQDGSNGTNGTNGTNGLNSATVFIYQRSASAPPLPSATATYTFATAATTGLNNGWSATIPAGSNPLYVSAAVASSTGTSDTIASGEWAAAVVLAQDGGTGAAGLNSATVYLFQRTSSASAPSLPSAAVTYTFASGVATGVNNGWTQSMPTSGGAFRWMTTAAALGTGTTDSIASGEWAAASLLAQDGSNGTNGTNGTNGLNSATVFIYQRSASAPTLPSATVTYTFATAATTGLNNGWSATIPAGSNPLYVSAAVASSTGTSDTIASGEWAAAVVLAQDGAAGGTGTAGLNAATVYLFQRTSSASAPSLPSAAVTYTFASGVATGVNNGWTQSMPTSGGAYRWMTTAVALGTGSTDSIASGEWAAASVLAQDGTNGTNGVDGVAATLSPGTLTLQADAEGVVTDFTGAATSMLVFKGGVNDTVNWTISATPSSGVSVSTSGATVSVTAMSVDAGYIDVSAARSGFSTLTVRCGVSKVRSSNYANMNSGVTITVDDVRAGPSGSARATARFLNDGRTQEVPQNGTTVAGANWFLPTTTGAGSAYSMKVELISGYSTISGVTLGAWTAMSSTVDVFISTSAIEALESHLKVSIAKPSNLGKVLATLYIDLTVEKI